MSKVKVIPETENNRSVFRVDDNENASSMDVWSYQEDGGSVFFEVKGPLAEITHMQFKKLAEFVGKREIK
jgi:hypothetical protein